jgi:two-component system, NarL family, nitrate/nitrite response regulator NarL
LYVEVGQAPGSVAAGQPSELLPELRETCHDMRQPIAGVLALAAAALTDPELPAAARGRLEQITDQAQWLADMVHSCLAAHAQEAPAEAESWGDGRADVVHVVSEVIAAACLTWAGDVMLTSPAGSVWCQLHPVLLRRVVSNVLGNATRAAGPSGAVTVEIRRHLGGVVLAVEDNGPGFGEIPSGTGLGLSAVARNVVKRGGKMEFGCGVHGGARVSLWLPLRIGRRSGPLRLVICDDNRILCEALAVALEARGHQVLATATTTVAGMAEVARHRPEACLLDLRFSEPPDGLDAARVIRQRYPETAVLMLSGVADPSVVAEATAIGVAGFLRKDRNVDEIGKALGVVASGGVVFGPAKTRALRSRAISPVSRARGLTSREREVLRRIVAGQGTGQMSREMNVTTSTLRTYIKTMLAKLGAHTRLEAAVLATRENLLGDQTA